MDSQQERELSNQARQGDLRAFEELVLLYERRLYAFALRVSGDREFAEEAVQESFVRAWSSLNRFDASRDFRCWLFGITAHLCTDWLRRRKLRGKAQAPDPLDDASADTPDPDPEASPHDALQRKELRELVAAAVRRLAPADRTVLLLRFEQTMKVREIAQVMRQSPKAVEIRIRRALAKLRPVLEHLYPELSALDSSAAENRAVGGGGSR